MNWLIFLAVFLVVLFLVTKLMFNTFRMFLRAFAVAVIFALLVFGYMKFFGSEKEEEILSCHLDLCDCKCYLEGWDSKGKINPDAAPMLCGINCLGEFGVSDCSYVQGKGCIELKE